MEFPHNTLTPLETLEGKESKEVLNLERYSQRVDLERMCYRYLFEIVSRRAGRISGQAQTQNGLP